MSQLQESYSQACMDLYAEMCKTFDVEDVVDRDKAFAWICDDGCIILANMLFDKYPDIVVNDEKFRIATFSNNLDMLELLFDTFPNSNVDVHELMRTSCDCGYLHILQWFTDRFQDVRVGEALLHVACEAGPLSIVKWILENYPTIKINADIFYSAYQDSDIVALLLDTFPDIDMHADDFRVLRHAKLHCRTMKILIDYTKDQDISYHTFKEPQTNNSVIPYIVSKHPLKTRHFDEVPVFDRYVYVPINVKVEYVDMIIAHAKANLLHTALNVSKKSAQK